MPLKSIRAWLGVDTPEKAEFAPLRETIEQLDHLEPDRARHLAAFAYLLGRVAQADQRVSPEETRAMEALVREQGQLSREQAMLVVQLAKTSNLLFGGTANFLVAREFSELASYDQKLALMRCLFALSATDEAISTLGGHLKTGHRSTLQNRPPRAWRPRPSVVDRVVVLWSSVLLSFNTTSHNESWLCECGNLAFFARFPKPCRNRCVVSMGLSFA